MSYPLDKALLLTRQRTVKSIKRANQPSKVEMEAQAYLERGAALWDAFVEAYPNESAAFAAGLNVAELLRSKT